MSSPYTTIGAPPDGVAWAALGIAFALGPALHAPSRRALGLRLRLRPELLVPILASCAALLSLAYVSHYLRGGPRIIDATSYYLQARAMAHGYFAFPVPSPLASFNGRFLLAREPHALSVIFPPGYPSLLALGFLLHAPLLVGPVLGALLVPVSYALGRELSNQSEVGCVAAALSVLSAALRYHTADTMSHGLCALLLAAGATCALRQNRGSALLSGFALGWLMSTRPISGLVGLVIGWCLLDHKLRRGPWFALGLAPGVLLLLIYQHAATGRYFSSAQLAYYALADGPPGCFHYGFGPQIGCLHEHGEYVRARLGAGFGLREAAQVSVRRLAVHSIDIANTPLLALLCIAGAWLGRSQRRVRIIFFGCLGFMLAYAPFYFDGSYPGGGARFFADLLPLEHALLALALVRLGWSFVALPLSLVGFAVHASFAHRALAEREGGHPMFEARALLDAGVQHGLVFVDTDHGFDLGHDPGQFDAQHAIVVARYRHDAHDYVLWKRLGAPDSYRYEYAPAEVNARPAIVPYTPSAQPLRFEAEAEWPPLGVRSAWAAPDFFPCASGNAGLRLRIVGPKANASLEFELPGLEPGPHPVRLGWVRELGPPTTLVLRSMHDPGADRTRSTLRASAPLTVIVPAGEPTCLELELGTLDWSADPTRLQLETSRSGLFDFIEMRP